MDETLNADPAARGWGTEAQAGEWKNVPSLNIPMTIIPLTNFRLPQQIQLQQIQLASARTDKHSCSRNHYMKTRIQIRGISANTKHPIKILVLISMLLAIASSTHGQTLGQALNATELTWTTSGTGGASGWLVESSQTHDGVSAAQSANISSPSRTSTLQTTVTGPGTLTFWHYLGIHSYSSFSFTVNGVNQSTFPSSPIWEQQTYYLGPGTQTLRWINSYGFGSGTAYLDEVSFTPGSTAPNITTQPLNQSQIPGFDTLFTAKVVGTPPLIYQWQFNATNIPNATNYSLVVSNVQAANLGIYTVIVTNGIDSVTSSNAQLGFGNATGWGYNYYGETSIAYGATNAATVSAASHGGMVLNANGRVSAWSTDAFGYAAVPADLTNAIAVASGSFHALALRSDGTVIAWGRNSSGETNVPVGLSNVVMIASGDQHNLALKFDGTVVSWGQDIFGQTNVPTGLSNVVAVSAGSQYSLALKADGTVVGWGGSGQATPPTGLSNVVAIAAGIASLHSLALKSDGTVVDWSLTGGTIAPLNLTNAVAIAAGGKHSLALRADGTVVAWGWNIYGQTNCPVGLTNVQAISAGYAHNLAVVGSGPPISTAPTFNPTLSSNGFNLSLPSQNGRVYALEFKNSLEDSNWVALPLVAGNGTNLTLIDPTATNSQRIYRVRRW